MHPVVGENDLEHRVKLYLAATRPELACVSVRAQGSTVKLSGQVATFYLRQLALAAARRVAGVQYVADDIEVALTAHERNQQAWAAMATN
jgi:osmotically-inducible protein OsmY